MNNVTPSQELCNEMKLLGWKKETLFVLGSIKYGKLHRPTVDEMFDDLYENFKITVNMNYNAGRYIITADCIQFDEQFQKWDMRLPNLVAKLWIFMNKQKK